MGKRKINKRYGAQRNYPQYPTKLEVLADPQLLLRSLPVAWRNNPYIMRALVSLVAANTVALAACDKSESDDDYGALSGMPLNGLGGYEESILLGETEVYELLQNEFRKNGILLEIDFDSKVDKDGPGPDLSNDDKTILAEYISESDYNRFGEGNYEDASRFDDIEDVAKWMVELYSEKITESHTLVVSEPLAFEYDTDDTICFLQNTTAPIHCQPIDQQDTGELAREILKQQVADFIDWLKAQGVL